MDNAAIHTAQVTSEYLKNLDIYVLEFPLYSPDLNIIENL